MNSTILEKSETLCRVHSVSFDDKNKIDFLTQKYKSESCERCFGNLFMWSNAYETDIMEWNNNLLIYRPLANLMYFPLGDYISPLELVEAMKALSVCVGQEVKNIYDVPSDYFEKFPDTSKYFTSTTESGDADYIYNVKHLISMNGARLRKKRNHIKHFIAENPQWKSEEINSSNIESAFDFIRKIQQNTNLYLEERAVDFAHKYYKDIDLRGVILYSEPQKIAAVAIMGKINDSIWTVHFEKSDKTVEGAPQMIVLLEAQYLDSINVSFMNREQDAGDSNLRHAKESLDPSHLYQRSRLFYGC